MTSSINRRQAIVAAGMLAATPLLRAQGSKAYGPGVTDTEIRIGQTMPYSGPLASNSIQGRVQAAYLQWLNDQGGINGRKINLLSVDDGYNPPKTVEQVRKLVETENVAFMFATLGTPTSMAVRKYLNDRKVPQLFCGSGAEALNDPAQFPWTMPWPPSFYDEGRILGRYVARSHGGEKIVALFQNDDYGKNVLRGFKEGLGPVMAKQLVAEASYQVTDPSVDSQVISLMGHSPTVFLNAATSKVAGQAARKLYELKRSVTHLVSYGAASGAVATKAPEGAEDSQVFVMGTFLKDPGSPQFAEDPAVKRYLEVTRKYYAEANPNEFYVYYGYACAQTLEATLRQCGDNLTRENIRRIASNLKNPKIELLLPGVTIANSAEDLHAVAAMQPVRYNGMDMEPIGKVESLK